MSASYADEKIITLAEAKTKFGYTADHLAYLCRKGFVWAERQGKIWLTCEQAILDYRQALDIAGKPVLFVEQHTFITPASSRPAAAPWLDQARNLPQWTTGAEFIEQIIAPRQFDTPTRGILQTYREIFRRWPTPYLLARPAMAAAGFSAGSAPARLPTAYTPAYMRFVPWYQDRLVAVPVVAILAVGMLVSLQINPRTAATTLADAGSAGLQIATWPLHDLLNPPEQMTSAQVLSGPVLASFPARAKSRTRASQVAGAATVRLPADQDLAAITNRIGDAQAAEHVRVFYDSILKSLPAGLSSALPQAPAAASDGVLQQIPERGFLPVIPGLDTQSQSAAPPDVFPPMLPLVPDLPHTGR